MTIDTHIDDTSVIKCVAQILGIEYTKEVSVSHYSSFWLGAGSSYEDVMVDSNLRQLNEGMVGSYDVEISSSGQHIILVLGESLASDFVRADMNGFEIPMTETTQIVDGITYKVFTSDNIYALGTYNIDINR
jgi:hypothetical protein